MAAAVANVQGTTDPLGIARAFVLVLLLLLLALGLKAVAVTAAIVSSRDASAICTGLGSADPLPDPACQAECQTDAVRILCGCAGAASEPGGVSFLLAAPLGAASSLAAGNFSVSVRDSSKQPRTCSYRRLEQRLVSCPNTTMLLVTVEPRPDQPFIVIRVEDGHRVAYYAFRLFVDQPCSQQQQQQQQQKDWVLVPGYILVGRMMESPASDLSTFQTTPLALLDDPVERFAAIVSRPSEATGSGRFDDSTFTVELLQDTRRIIWIASVNVSSCTGTWCTFDVKQSISPAQWLLALTADYVSFKFSLPEEYIKLYNAASPLSMSTTYLRQWKPADVQPRSSASLPPQTRSTEFAAGMVVCSAAAADHSVNGNNCATDSGSSGRFILAAAAVAAAFAVVAACLVAFVVIRRHRRRHSGTDTRTASVMVVAPLGVMRRHLLDLAWLWLRLRRRGCRLAFERLHHSVERLRSATVLEGRVFILVEGGGVGGDGSGDQLLVLRDLQQLTVPEKCRYTLVMSPPAAQQPAPSALGDTDWWDAVSCQEDAFQQLCSLLEKEFLS